MCDSHRQKVLEKHSTLKKVGWQDERLREGVWTKFGMEGTASNIKDVAESKILRREIIGTGASAAFDLYVAHLPAGWCCQSMTMMFYWYSCYSHIGSEINSLLICPWDKVRLHSENCGGTKWYMWRHMLSNSVLLWSHRETKKVKMVNYVYLPKKTSKTK